MTPAFRSALVELSIALGVIAIFSVGLLFLLAVVGIAAASADRWSGSGVRAVASGTAMAVGLATAAFNGHLVDFERVQHEL